MNIFNNIFKSRDKPTNYLGGLSFLFGQTAAGKTVNERSAMQVTAVYACVRVLAESIAGLPLHVYRNNDTGSAVASVERPTKNGASFNSENEAPEKLQNLKLIMQGKLRPLSKIYLKRMPNDMSMLDEDLDEKIPLAERKAK